MKTSDFCWTEQKTEFAGLIVAPQSGHAGSFRETFKICLPGAEAAEATDKST